VPWPRRADHRHRSLGRESAQSAAQGEATPATTGSESRSSEPSPANLGPIFEPEAFGRRLRRGAPEALRTKLHRGGTDLTGAIWDVGPRGNGHGDALVVTAAFGAYRDDTAPCPGPWQAVLRWSGSSGRGKLWQTKIAPRRAAATNIGFVLTREDPCIPRGASPRDTTDWYVDSRGRIGHLRLTPGEPPAGLNLDAPGEAFDYYNGTTDRPRTLLADRHTERIWSVSRPDLRAANRPFVIAQDATGRRWTVTWDTNANGMSVGWSDDRGATWETHHSGRADSFLYTDRAIAFLAGHSLIVSTDRANTWQERRLPTPTTVGAPPGSHFTRSVHDVIATSSGDLVIRFRQANRHRASGLMRSTDPTWSTFTRSGSTPYPYPVTAKEDVLWNCERGVYGSTGACSYSADLGRTWHGSHLPR